MGKIPYTIAKVTTPTLPPITWDVLIVAAYADPPAGSPVLLRRTAPLKVGAQDLGDRLEGLVDFLANAIRKDAVRGGLRLRAFHKPHEKLTGQQTRAMQNAIMSVLKPSRPNGNGRHPAPIIVQPGRG